MDNSNFYKLSANEIQTIYDLIQEKSDDIDVDYYSEVLHIYTKDGEYIINQHSPTSQIWLSSPVSNAGYFNYSLVKKDWYDKNGVSLKQRLSNDLNLSLL